MLAGIVSSHREYREKLGILIQWVGLTSGIPMPPPPSSTIDENPLPDNTSMISISQVVSTTKSAVSAGEALLASGLKMPAGLRSPLSSVKSPLAEAEHTAYTHSAEGLQLEAAIVRRRKAAENVKAMRRLDEDLKMWGSEENFDGVLDDGEEEDIWREAWEEAQRAQRLAGTMLCIFVEFYQFTCETLRQPSGARIRYYRNYAPL